MRSGSDSLQSKLLIQQKNLCFALGIKQNKIKTKQSCCSFYKKILILNHSVKRFFFGSDGVKCRASEDL